MKKILLTIAFGLALVSGLMAAELGDDAKPLDTKDWVKGSPVDLAAGKGKTIYVVEFWATWCPPCRTSIPHLTDMQKKFKDQGVVFIGVSDEKTDVVKKFVEKMGDKMDYTVAIDGGKTSEGYMEAYGVRGIPHAFIVDKAGKVVWHGHPMDQLEETLAQVVAGKFDMSTAKRRASVQSKLSEYVELTLSGKEPERVAQLEADLVALEKEFGNIMNGEKFDPADVKKRIAFGQANLQKSMAGRKEAMKIQTLFKSYAEASGEAGDAEKAADLGKQLAAMKIENAELLNGIAWTILTDERIKNRDTKLALDFSKRAVDATEGKEASMLDTYARALFDNGNKAEAIVQQKKAIEIAEDDDLKTELQETLTKYEGTTPAAK